MPITGWKVIASRTSSGTSSRSAVALRQDHVREPGRVRGQHLLLQPADRQHQAWGVTSPVIPTVCFTRRPLSSDASAVVIVMPALRPSFGIAPAGTWVELPVVEGVLVDAERLGVPAHVESAIRADSFMTSSPSCPTVGTRPSLPFIEVASMNSTSPPAPVTDRPVATPGIAVRSADSWKKRCRRGRRAPRPDRSQPELGLAGDLRRGLAEQRPEFALEVPDARLAGVLGHDAAQHVVGDRHLVLAQSVPIALARPQVALAIATFSSLVYPSKRTTSMRSSSGRGSSRPCWPSR